MSNEQFVIDFRRLGGPVYSGRAKGEQAREALDLDSLDEQEDAKILVRVPSNAYSVTTSFFLGLFGKSVRKAGSRDKFLARFTFEAPSVFNKTFDTCITRALQEQRALVGSGRKRH